MNNLKLLLVGINHKTARVALREKLAIGAEGLSEALWNLQSYFPHGVIVSTCNRTEICTLDNAKDEAQKAVLAFIAARLQLPQSELSKYVTVSHDNQAVEHLFRVASGLESMVVGEYEVLGQVKQSLDAAEKAQMVNLPLRQVFQSAIRTGRRVREETGISKNALSVSSVAVELAAGKIGDLTKSRMLVLGAGEAGRLVAKVARERGTSQICIASRTKSRAKELADTLKAIPVDLSELPDELVKTDIVVTCAGAPHRLLDVHALENAMKHRPDRPLVIIDIALPRNVEPEVGSIHNVFLFNIDHLKEISTVNRKQRQSEVSSAEKIITEEVEKFAAWWADYEVRPVIGALMARAEEIRAAQLEQTLKKLPPLTDEQMDNLEAMTRSIVTKILSSPINYLKSNGNGHGHEAELIKGLFQLHLEKHG